MKNKKTISIFFIVLALIFLFTACGGNRIDNVNPDINYLNITDGGMSGYTIVIPENPTETEVYAASELTDFFSKCTKIVLPTKKDNEVTYSADGKFISIGHCKLLNDGKVEYDKDKLYTDGFIIKFKDDNIFLTGAKDRGTLYSVYDFLERYLGVRFFAEDCTLTPDVKNLNIPAVDIEEIPAFWGRDVHQYNTIFNPDFSARIRNNGVLVNLTAKHGLGSMAEWSPSWAHSFFALLPPSVYREEHPDWYSFSGKDDGKGGELAQLCLTNEGCVNQFIINLKKQILDTPNAKYFAVTQEDGGHWCDCENCRASDEKYLPGGTLIRFVNKIAEAIEEWQKTDCPDREIYLVTFAYGNTGTAPVIVDGKDIKPIDESVIPRNNVILRATSHSGTCFNHSLEDITCMENEPTRNSLDGWKALTDKLMFWGYTTDFFNYFTYFPIMQNFAENLKTYKKYGIMDILENGPYNTPHTEFQELKSYVLAKLMWNPNQDTNALISEFLNGYYGIAAPYVEEYLELMELHFEMLDRTLEQGYHIRASGNEYGVENWPKRLMEQACDLWSSAIEFVKSNKPEDNEILVKRLTAGRLAPKYMIYKFYPYYYDESGYREYMEKYFEELEYVGVTRFDEWGSTVPEVKEQILSGI